MDDTKERLLLESEQHFHSLMKLIESVPVRKRSLSIETDDRDKNFRDILMHLYEWHAMLERWYREGMAGDTPSMPAPGYKWRDIQPLNQQIWENYQDMKLNQAIMKCKLSHERIMNIIRTHTTEEIITKKHYKWTKTSNLYSYFAANTSKHYLWAMGKCEKIVYEINAMNLVSDRNK